MNIEKIGVYSVKSINFGKVKRNAVPNNTNRTTRKNSDVKFVLGTLAGMTYLAYKNRKLTAEVEALKKQIVPEKDIDDMSKNAAGTDDTSDKSAAVKKDDKPSGSLAGDNSLAESLARIKQKREGDSIVKFSPKFSIDKTSSVAENTETIENGMSLENFRKANGRFLLGDAYINGNAYTGNIVIEGNKKKIELSYEQGQLKQSVSSLKNVFGKYEKNELRTYDKNPDGTRVTEVFERDYAHRKVGEDELFYETWQKTEVIQVSDSKISIEMLTHFGDYLGTYFKKQKDGSWKGFYEKREYNNRTKMFDIVPRNIYTDEKLSRRAARKIMA